MPALRGLRAGLFQDCGGTAGSATPHPALIPQPLWGRKANAVKNRREPSPARPPSSEASGRWRSRLLLGAWRATHHFCSRLFLVFLERSDSKHRERGSPCLLLLWDLLAGTRAAGSGWNSTVRCRLHLSQPHVPTGTFHPAGRSHRAAPEGALDPCAITPCCVFLLGTDRARSPSDLTSVPATPILNQAPRWSHSHRCDLHDTGWRGRTSGLCAVELCGAPCVP